MDPLLLPVPADAINAVLHRHGYAGLWAQTVLRRRTPPERACRIRHPDGRLHEAPAAVLDDISEALAPWSDKRIAEVEMLVAVTCAAPRPIRQLDLSLLAAMAEAVSAVREITPWHDNQWHDPANPSAEDGLRLDLGQYPSHRYSLWIDGGARCTGSAIMSRPVANAFTAAAWQFDGGQEPLVGPEGEIKLRIPIPPVISAHARAAAVAWLIGPQCPEALRSHATAMLGPA